jgi:hypothetical protein
MNKEEKKWDAANFLKNKKCVVEYINNFAESESYKKVLIKSLIEYINQFADSETYLIELKTYNTKTEKILKELENELLG